MEFEFIKEKVKLPSKNRGKYSEVIEQWLATENKTLKFKFATTQEADNCSICACSYRKAHNYDFTVVKRLCEVYVVRA